MAMVSDFLAPPFYMHHLLKADVLLEKFQACHEHLFVVKDGSGKDIGLMGMEDVLEELFGEIYDERDVARTARADKGDKQS